MMVMVVVADATSSVVVDDVWARSVELPTTAGAVSSIGCVTSELEGTPVKGTGVEGTAVEDTAVEGTAAEDTAVEGTAAEGTAVGSDVCSISDDDRSRSSPASVVGETPPRPHATATKAQHRTTEAICDLALPAAVRRRTTAARGRSAHLKAAADGWSPATLPVILKRDLSAISGAIPPTLDGDHRPR